MSGSGRTGGEWPTELWHGVGRVKLLLQPFKLPHSVVLCEFPVLVGVGSGARAILSDRGMFVFE